MLFVFLKGTATTRIYTYGHTLPLRDALPIASARTESLAPPRAQALVALAVRGPFRGEGRLSRHRASQYPVRPALSGAARRHLPQGRRARRFLDRKSTRLNSSH